MNALQYITDKEKIIFNAVDHAQALETTQQCQKSKLEEFY